jgi:hypothetical protein
MVIFEAASLFLKIDITLESNYLESIDARRSNTEKLPLFL